MIELSEKEIGLTAFDVLSHISESLHDDECTKVWLAYMGGFIPSGIKHEITNIQKTAPEELTVTYRNGQKFRVTISEA